MSDSLELRTEPGPCYGTACDHVSHRPTLAAIELALLRIRMADLTRDGWIREADAAGFSKTKIHQMTGIARTMIDRILAADRSL